MCDCLCDKLLFTAKMNKTEVINVRVPKEILKDLDKVIQSKKYATRSEVIRSYIREYISEELKNQFKEIDKQ